MAFKKQIDGVLTVYFRIHEGLYQDDAKDVQEQGRSLLNVLKTVDMGLLSGDAHMAWMKELRDLNEQSSVLEKTSDINKQREAFYLISESLTSVVRQFGTSGKQAVLQFHCPMAFDNRGAHWLQNKSGVQNPYFGPAMPQCGEQTATLVES